MTEAKKSWLTKNDILMFATARKQVSKSNVPLPICIEHIISCFPPTNIERRWFLPRALRFLSTKMSNKHASIPCEIRSHGKFIFACVLDIYFELSLDFFNFWSSLKRKNGFGLLYKGKNGHKVGRMNNVFCKKRNIW